MPSDTNKNKHAIVIANDLLTGRSVYLTRQSKWSESVADADLLETGDAADSRLKAAMVDQDKNIVIDPYLIAVGADRSIHVIRELIRTTGPSVLDRPGVLDVVRTADVA